MFLALLSGVESGMFFYRTVTYRCLFWPILRADVRRSNDYYLVCVSEGVRST